MKTTVKCKPLDKAQAMSERAVKKATGKTLQEWIELLKKTKAESLSHKEIALLLFNKYRAGDWWARMLTVEYEISIGRREVGQTCTGDFQASASKTLPGSMDAALRAWQKLVGKMTEFDGVNFAGNPGVSKTEKWRYWRVKLEDNSKVTVVICDKGRDKTQLGVNHDKLTDSKALMRCKSFWKNYLLGLDDRTKVSRKMK